MKPTKSSRKRPKVKPGAWQPIETAPRDGRRFIAYDPRAGLLFSMHWSDGEFITDDERWSGVFTHWMPLPEPPE